MKRYLVNPSIEVAEFAFRVYGDNILECLHFVSWLDDAESSGFRTVGQVGALDRPVIVYEWAQRAGSTYAFQLCPYYGGTGRQSHWANDPLEDTFSEKVDVAVTRVLDGGTETKPVLAIEFCDAIQAGNQAWQRFRRAYSAATAGLPYFYVLPIIGWERDSAGITLKGARYQNAQIALGQLTLCSRLGVPSLHVYTSTSWLEYAESEGQPLPAGYESFADERHGMRYAGHLLRASVGETQDPSEGQSLLKPIIQGMISVAKTYGKYKNTHFPIHMAHPVFTAREEDEQPADVYAEAIADGVPVAGEYALHTLGASEFKEHGSLFYKDVQQKTTSEEFRDEVMRWLNWKDTYGLEDRRAYLRKWGIDVPHDLGSRHVNGLAEQNRGAIPVTYKAGKAEACFVGNRRVLRKILSDRYPALDAAVLRWIEGDERDDRPVLVVPLYAYKPSGDSRPDRGLLPCLVGLFPCLTEHRNILVVVYSKYTPNRWREKMQAGDNELWNVIGLLAGAVIVDKTEDGMLLVDQVSNGPD